MYAHEAAQENVVFGVPDADMGEELAMIAYDAAVVRPYGDRVAQPSAVSIGELPRTKIH